MSSIAFASAFSLRRDDVSEFAAFLAVADFRDCCLASIPEVFLGGRLRCMLLTGRMYDLPH